MERWQSSQTGNGPPLAQALLGKPAVAPSDDEYAHGAHRRIPAPLGESPDAAGSCGELAHPEKNLDMRGKSAGEWRQPMNLENSQAPD
jgi:hypothetical protein